MPRRLDRATRGRRGAGQDASPQGRPFKPGWAKEVHVWRFSCAWKFLAAIIVTIILMVWSITLNAPLEETGKPQTSPLKPGESAVVFPRLAGNAGLLRSLDRRGGHAHPNHRRPDGHSLYRHQPSCAGYYTWKQRKFAIGTFLFGFIILWVSMIFIGTSSAAPMAVVLARADMDHNPAHL